MTSDSEDSLESLVNLAAEIRTPRDFLLVLDAAAAAVLRFAETAKDFGADDRVAESLRMFGIKLANTLVEWANETVQRRVVDTLDRWPAAEPLPAGLADGACYDMIGQGPRLTPEEVSQMCSLAQKLLLLLTCTYAEKAARSLDMKRRIAISLASLVFRWPSVLLFLPGDLWKMLSLLVPSDFHRGPETTPYSRRLVTVDLISCWSNLEAVACRALYDGAELNDPSCIKRIIRHAETFLDFFQSPTVTELPFEDVTSFRSDLTFETIYTLAKSSHLNWLKQDEVNLLVCVPFDDPHYRIFHIVLPPAEDFFLPFADRAMARMYAEVPGHFLSEERLWRQSIRTRVVERTVFQLTGLHTEWAAGHLLQDMGSRAYRLVSREAKIAGLAAVEASTEAGVFEVAYLLQGQLHLEINQDAFFLGFLAAFVRAYFFSERQRHAAPKSTAVDSKFKSARAPK